MNKQIEDDDRIAHYLLRARFAESAMAALISRYSSNLPNICEFADLAVRAADALISRLNQGSDKRSIK